MQRLRIAVIGLAVLLGGSAAARASDPVATASPSAPVRVTTRVEPKTVTIGTPFRYTMRVEAAGEVELVVPILAGQIGDFLVTDFGEVPSKEAGHQVVERWYTLVTYETGNKIIPGPTVQYRVPGSGLERVDAPDTLVTVESLLKAKEGEPLTGDVRDIKGPVAVPRDYRPLWWVAAGLVLLGALLFAAYHLLNRRRSVAAVPPRPAHEVALEALARLRASRLIESGRPDEYYVRLSAVVRAYLEGRFQLRAPEMTTEEFLQAAQRNPQLVTEHRALLSRFLTEADLVKFARYEPSQEDAERAYAAARQFIESTVPQAEASRAAA